MEETDEAEHEGRNLADRRCAFGRGYESYPACERRAQHAAAVHREGGNEVKECKKRFNAASRSTIGICMSSMPIAAPARGFACANAISVPAMTTFTAGPAIDEEFLPRLLRNALELRDAAAVTSHTVLARRKPAR